MFDSFTSHILKRYFSFRFYHFILKYLKIFNHNQTSRDLSTSRISKNYWKLINYRSHLDIFISLSNILRIYFSISLYSLIKIFENFSHRDPCNNSYIIFIFSLIPFCFLSVKNPLLCIFLAISIHASSGSDQGEILTSA